MRILIVDQFAKNRDAAQSDMYEVISAFHSVTFTNDPMPFVLKREYDILFLGIYHRSIDADWEQVLFHNFAPVLIDQADNEEFCLRPDVYKNSNRKTLLARYLPNKDITKWADERDIPVKLLPWFVRPDRFRVENKTCDIAYVCSMYGERIKIANRIEVISALNGFTHTIGEYYGHEYSRILSKCRVSVVECARKCLTQKYIESALSGCVIIGDVPDCPSNDFVVTKINLSDAKDIQSAIWDSLSSPSERNREMVLDTYANRDWFLKIFNSLL